MPAKRSLGQNFLNGSHYPKRIVASLAPRAGETIIEIGPGQGALTELLLESGAQVCAIELDRELIRPLTERFAHHANFHLIAADALEVNLGEIIAPAATARVVANLPYNVATPILQRLIAQRGCLTELTLMFQREVGERIAARPGGKEYGYLSVLCQFYCQPEKLFDVPPGAFRPVPKVVSSVLRLRVREQPQVVVGDERFFLAIVSALFTQRRKTILNNLKAIRAARQWKDDAQIVDALMTAGIDPHRRAETLTVPEIACLSEALYLATEK